MSSRILCGHKACGKTTVAKAYSQRYGCDYWDTDALLVAHSPLREGGCPVRIADLYAALGEQAFREQEYALLGTLRHPQKAAVIATGGGVVLHPDHHALLKSLGTVIYLRVDGATLAQRWHQHAALPRFFPRPFSQANFDAHVRYRDRLYLAVADVVIEAAACSLTALVTQVHACVSHHKEQEQHSGK